MSTIEHCTLVRQNELEIIFFCSLEQRQRHAFTPNRFTVAAMRATPLLGISRYTAEYTEKPKLSPHVRD